MSHPGIQRHTLVVDPALDRLQAFLLEMLPGDQLDVDHAVQICRLSRHTCLQVLDALTRAGLLRRMGHDAYVRGGDSMTES